MEETLIFENERWQIFVAITESVFTIRQVNRVTEEDEMVKWLALNPDHAVAVRDALNGWINDAGSSTERNKTVRYSYSVPKRAGKNTISKSTNEKVMEILTICHAVFGAELGEVWARCQAKSQAKMNPMLTGLPFFQQMEKASDLFFKYLNQALNHYRAEGSPRSALRHAGRSARDARGDCDRRDQPGSRPVCEAGY